MENQGPVLWSPLRSHILLPYKVRGKRKSLNPKGIIVFPLWWNHNLWWCQSTQHKFKQSLFIWTDHHWTSNFTIKTISQHLYGNRSVSAISCYQENLILTRSFLTSQSSVLFPLSNKQLKGIQVRPAVFLNAWPLKRSWPFGDWLHYFNK